MDRAALPHRTAGAVTVATLVVLALAGAACGSSAPAAAPARRSTVVPTTAPARSGTTTAGPGTRSPASATQPPPAPAFRLVVEPQDDEISVDQLIAGAHRAIDLTMYELADPQIESLLVAARRRGVSVRVLLDRDYHGASVNAAAFALLDRAGVPVRWAPHEVIFHQKTVTVDGATSAVMTGNLTSQYYATTRDFVVIDRDPRAVAAIESVFGDDWNGDPVSGGPTVAGLVWSPGAEPALVGLIDSARRSITVENEEMDQSDMESALEAAARRGVQVEVVMTADTEWDTVFRALTDAGAHVGTYPDTSSALYIHAKAIVVDGSTAFVGSQNFSTSSLDHNRELGIITADPAVVGPVSGTLSSDVAGATPFESPTIPVGAAPAAAPPVPSGSSAPAPAAGPCLVDPEGRCYRPGEYCPYARRGQTVEGATGLIICTDDDGWRWEPSG